MAEGVDVKVTALVLVVMIQVPRVVETRLKKLIILYEVVFFKAAICSEGV